LIRATISLALLPCLCAAQGLNEANLAWMQETLAWWEKACREDLRISPKPLPWIIFYDEVHAWHVSPERRLLPPHRRTKHSLRFAGGRYRIYEMDNDGSGLWVPERRPLELKAQGFALPYARDSKALFILAVPALQAKAAGYPLTKDLADFFAGAALHEIAHTRQLPYLMPVLRALQSRHKLPESIDDNLIERTFSGNEEFLKMRGEAGKHFNAAVLAQDDGVARDEARKAIVAMRALRKRFFTGDYQGWAELEDIFLTLEGAAMMLHFQHSRKVAGQEDWRQTLYVLMERSNSWSQSDGLGVFLLISRFDPKWPKRFFSNSAPPSALDVLEGLLGPSSKP